ncbi:hypothetical protein C1646_774214 [Rhizophagus diaphanus]|nr:hypothetical protein C1646_774214 [Rhizophagus diaphanus] [Rhizophagus sp. MUCL 43196]
MDLHTETIIPVEIIKSIQNGIEDQVITITTDNGANVVVAIHELAPIERLSCAAHTLKLAIEKD